LILRFDEKRDFFPKSSAGSGMQTTIGFGAESAVIGGGGVERRAL